MISVKRTVPLNIRRRVRQVTVGHARTVSSSANRGRDASYATASHAIASLRVRYYSYVSFFIILWYSYSYEYSIFRNVLFPLVTCFAISIVDCFTEAVRNEILVKKLNASKLTWLCRQRTFY